MMEVSGVPGDGSCSDGEGTVGAVVTVVAEDVEGYDCSDAGAGRRGPDWGGGRAANMIGR